MEFWNELSPFLALCRAGAAHGWGPLPVSIPTSNDYTQCCSLMGRGLGGPLLQSLSSGCELGSFYLGPPKFLIESFDHQSNLMLFV